MTETGSTEGWARFNLMLVGLGDNVHVESLFPGSPALQPEFSEAGCVETCGTHPGAGLPAGKIYFQQIAALREAGVIG